MASYWDRTDRQRARAAERKQFLRELQLAQWGWCDMRQRDGTGRLIPPRKRRRADACASHTRETREDA